MKKYYIGILFLSTRDSKGNNKRNIYIVEFENNEKK
jgi:hypothetical protein